MNICDDCIIEICRWLPPTDWLAFILTNKHINSLPTTKEKEIRINSRKGLPLNIKNNNYETVIHILQYAKDVVSFTNSLLLAAAYDRLDIVKWLIGNKRIVMNTLGWALYMAIVYKSDKVCTYLMGRVIPNRRYYCIDEIRFGKVRFKGQGAFKISEWHTYKDDRKKYGEIIFNSLTK